MRKTDALITNSVKAQKIDRVQIAKLISLVLHPFLVAPLSIFLILYLDRGELWTALGWAALCAALVVGPALLYVYWRVRQKQYTDADVSVREHRHSFYFFGGSCVLICLAVLFWLGAPQALIAYILAALEGLSAFIIINRFWTKISIHTGIMTGITVTVAFYSVFLALLLACGILLIIWSRLTLKQHTLGQTILGGIVATFCILSVFLPLGLI